MLNLFVPGTPVQQGSMKAFAFQKGNGRLGVSMVHNKGDALTKWRENIRTALLTSFPDLKDAQENGGLYAQHVPVCLEVTFYLAKPKSNRLKAPSNKKADLDKLVRAVGDALSGIVYYDDCQIVEIKAEKRWGTEEYPEGVLLSVYPLNTDATQQ